MPKELFFDGVQSIDLIRGAVRIDLVCLAPAEASGGAPKPELCRRLVVPIEGFLQSLVAMQHFATKLEKGGVIKRTDPAVTESGTAVVAGPRNPSSPNFT